MNAFAGRRIAGIFLLLLVNICLLSLMESRSQVSALSLKDMESEEFRYQACTRTLLDELDRQPQKERVRLLTVSMLLSGYRPEHLLRDDQALRMFRKNVYERMLDVYESIWTDVVCFPLMEEKVWYEDTWMASRDYGGNRRHEGTDLFGGEDISDCYPVVSMTEGIVEQVGWLPLGGYRIGIRAPHGGYYYYAHLASYEREFEKGDAVIPGEVLGYMGNTGYGAEGTSGRFPVHLHLGIYIRTERCAEMSVNPYWVLRYIEKNSKR